jgi:hypothetical protein
METVHGLVTSVRMMTVIIAGVLQVFKQIAECVRNHCLNVSGI